MENILYVKGLRRGHFNRNIAHDFHVIRPVEIRATFVKIWYVFNGIENNFYYSISNYILRSLSDIDVTSLVAIHELSSTLQKWYFNNLVFCNITR